eukprot:9139929-Pyramimonas_sp.AAC.1
MGATTAVAPSPHVVNLTDGTGLQPGRNVHETVGVDATSILNAALDRGYRAARLATDSAETNGHGQSSLVATTAVSTGRPHTSDASRVPSDPAHEVGSL